MVKWIKMKQELIELKQKIESNYQALEYKHNDIFAMTIQILDTINLLLNTEITDDKIERYLKSIRSSLEIIEERISFIKKD